MNTEVIEMSEITDELIISIATVGARRRFSKELAEDLKKQGFTCAQREKIRKEVKIEVTHSADDIAAARFALESGLSPDDAKKFVKLDDGDFNDRLTLILRENAQKARQIEQAELARLDYERRQKRYQEDCLKGTDKQIAWAKEIRSKVVCYHGGKTEEAREEFTKAARKITSASWWIHHQNFQYKHQNRQEENYVNAYILKTARELEGK